MKVELETVPAPEALVGMFVEAAANGRFVAASVTSLCLKKPRSGAPYWVYGVRSHSGNSAWMTESVRACTAERAAAMLGEAMCAVTSAAVYEARQASMARMVAAMEERAAGARALEGFARAAAGGTLTPHG